MIGETMICPKCGHIANHDSYFGAIVCRQCGWMHYDKPTNADRIRSMSDEELAEFLCHIEAYRTYGYYAAHGLDWLRRQAEGDNK